MSETIIEQHLKALSLHRIMESYKTEAENAAKAKLGYQDYLLRLVETEVLSKIERSINRKMQIAGFPQIKRLEEFDFSYQPQLNENLSANLHHSTSLKMRRTFYLWGLQASAKLIWQ